MTETIGTFIHRQLALHQLRQQEQALHQLKWEEIKEPGAYVEVSTGNLYRVPREYLPKGTSRSMRNSGGPTSPLVLLSKDPFIFALAARMICLRHDIHPSF
jgi:hypothetical protein